MGEAGGMREALVYIVVEVVTELAKEVTKAWALHHVERWLQRGDPPPPTPAHCCCCKERSNG